MAALRVRWNANGKELFYVATDDRLMAVPIRVHLARQRGRRTWNPPLGLFATNVGSAAIQHETEQQYAVSPRTVSRS